MNKTKTILRTKKTFFPKTIFTFFLLFFFLFTANPVIAQGNSKAAQWTEAGGEMIMSGNHNFTTTWSSHANSRQDNNKYWRGGFWGDREPQIPFESTVRNSVAPVKGQITVLGPGNIGLFQKGKGARIHMNDSETKAGFTPWTNTISFSSQVWSGNVKDYNPNGEFWGFISAGTEITLDITAAMSMYNNQGGTGEISFNAPQDVEYEIWFFPREGGGVISVTSSSGSGKPMPGDVYYTDKECK